MNTLEISCDITGAGPVRPTDLGLPQISIPSPLILARKARESTARPLRLAILMPLRLYPSDPPRARARPPARCPSAGQLQTLAQVTPPSPLAAFSHFVPFSWLVPFLSGNPPFSSIRPVFGKSPDFP